MHSNNSLMYFIENAHRMAIYELKFVDKNQILKIRPK
jgi:hypothetical protein